MHKGFKCLEVSTGHIYISRDVVFDENIFLFAKLHPNAGARLRGEILLLPSSLISPESLHNRVNIQEALMTDSTNPANPIHEAGDGVQLAAEIHVDDIQSTPRSTDSTTVSAPVSSSAHVSSPTPTSSAPVRQSLESGSPAL
jgi:hypothetical protein